MKTIDEIIADMKALKNETDNVYVLTAINKAIQEIRYGPASRE